MKPDELLTILGDAPQFFQPLPEGVERRSYTNLTPEKFEETLNHLYYVNRLMAEEITRQRVVIVLSLTRLKWLWRALWLACTVAAAAWTPLWLPMLMKFAGLK